MTFCAALINVGNEGPLSQFRSWQLMHMQEINDLEAVTQCHSASAIPQTATHTRFTALFKDYLGEPVPGENFWTVWCKGR